MSETAGVVTVRLSGNAGVVGLHPLDTALLRLSARRPPLVLLDLSELRFISLLVLGTLVRYRHGANRAGVRVLFMPAFQPSVRDALERTGLVDLFGVWQKED